jgi:hypothetical protein
MIEVKRLTLDEIISQLLSYKGVLNELKNVKEYGEQLLQQTVV